jgi:hypothetical protein
MTAITFDTLKFANTLKAAGVPPAQAEAEAVALSEVLEVNLKDLATKEDLRLEIRDLEQRMEAKIDKTASDLKVDLIKWMAGALVAQAAVIATLFKLL